MKTLQNVYTFWFDKKDNYNKWFIDSKKNDTYITRHFKELLLFYKKKNKNSTIHYEEYTMKELISLIILFDQFSRQIYRGSPKAYAMDTRSKDISLYLIENGLIENLSENEQLFALLPLQHSTNLEDLYILLELLYILNNNKLFVHHTREHIKVLQLFDRYPKRNKSLAIKSTPAEMEYIKNSNNRDY